MEKNIFKLDNEQLKGIAHAFREKVEEGLNKNNAEIQCIPTFILPKATDVKRQGFGSGPGRYQL